MVAIELLPLAVHNKNAHAQSFDSVIRYNEIHYNLWNNKYAWSGVGTTWHIVAEKRLDKVGYSRWTQQQHKVFKTQKYWAMVLALSFLYFISQNNWSILDIPPLISVCCARHLHPWKVAQGSWICMCWGFGTQLEGIQKHTHTHTHRLHMDSR